MSKFLEKEKNILSIIPVGLTRFIQPLDVSINKLFKGALKKEYVNYCIELKDENINITREKMIEFIYKICMIKI